MSAKKNPVVHFEMPAEDRARMARFYAQVFGWETQMLGPEMGDYVLVSTTDTDANRMVKTPGTINGGFYPKKPDWPAQYPSITIAVDDIRGAMKNVTSVVAKFSAIR